MCFYTFNRFSASCHGHLRRSQLWAPMAWAWFPATMPRRTSGSSSSRLSSLSSRPSSLHWELPAAWGCTNPSFLALPLRKGRRAFKILKRIRMYQIKYILVNETVRQKSVCDARHRFIPHIGHCIECFVSSRFQVQGSKFKVLRSGLRSSLSSASFAATGPMPKSLACRNWTSREATLPCAYLKP